MQLINMSVRYRYLKAPAICHNSEPVPSISEGHQRASLY